MARPFFNAVAEQVVAVTEAVVVSRPTATVDFIIEFTQLRQQNAENALKLAEDIGLISHDSGTYSVSSFLSQYLVTSDQSIKPNVLRLLLENYEPFTAFRDRLATTQDASTAAHQTKTIFDLDSHQDDIRDTLLSLGTFAQAIESKGGGQYAIPHRSVQDLVIRIRPSSESLADCRIKIREQLGDELADSIQQDTVIYVLAEGLRHATQGLSREAILQTGNAVENYLLWYGNEKGVDLSTRHGINARIDTLSDANHIPTKHKFIGKYLGHLRNAADHGIDSDTGEAWEFRPELGLEYSAVACGFIISTWQMLTNSEYSL